MKHTLFFTWLLVILFLSKPLFSQVEKFDPNQKIPFDSTVIKGKLENGLTYYIKHNEKPKNKAELRLVVNAGSILENDSQQGLAHFVEHMCFNGTKHFDKNELESFLQSLGIEFGGDLNAYTSFDETVYMLSIPSEDIDTGLLVLRDWAGSVTFADDEIDKERGVILEELRLGRGAQQRMRDKYFPTLFKNSRYAERLPIGKKKIIETFPHDTLRSFYKDWYRPDLQAIIVVGDIDPKNVEKKIKSKFGDLKNPSKYRKRSEYPVPDHKETFVKVVSDKEAPYTVVQIYYKDDTSGVRTWGDYRESIAQDLFNGMLQKRLQELTQKPDPPFMYAYSGYGGLTRTKNSFTSFAIVGPGGIEKGLKSLLRENRRVKKYGFTQSELDRYKTEYLKNIEKSFKEKNKTKSARYVNEYVGNFLEDEPSPGIDKEYEYVKKELPRITLNDVNKYASKWIKDSNRVVIVAAPEKEGVVLPSEKEVLGWVEKSDNEETKAYEDKVSDKPLMATIPEAGTIVSDKRYKKIGVHEYLLDNGVKVVIKPTDFKDDEVLFYSYSFGGSSMFPDDEYLSAEKSSSIVIESGVNGFSKIELQKILSGKNVRVWPYVSTTKQGISGNSSKTDFETALQLINLYYTKPNFDKDAFTSYINKQKMILANLMEDPNYYFDNKVRHILANNHPRGNYMLTVEDLDKISLEKAEKAYLKMFGSAKNYTFFFVGNIDIDKDLPLIKKYLGSLPQGNETFMYRDLGIRPPKGPLKKVIYKGLDPKSQVRIYYTGEAEYKPYESYLLSSLGELLTIKLIENLREDMSGVYGVGASGYENAIPYGKYTFRIGFPCGPENVDKLTVAALKEVEKLKVPGPEEKDVEKVKATQLVNYKENIESNSYWLSSLSNSWQLKRNPEDILKVPEKIKSLNKKKLKKVANKFIKDTNKIEIVLMPETGK